MLMMKKIRTALIIFPVIISCSFIFLLAAYRQLAVKCWLVLPLNLWGEVMATWA